MVRLMNFQGRPYWKGRSVDEEFVSGERGGARASRPWCLASRQTHLCQYPSLKAAPCTSSCRNPVRKAQGECAAGRAPHHDRLRLRAAAARQDGRAPQSCRSSSPTQSKAVQVKKLGFDGVSPYQENSQMLSHECFTKNNRIFRPKSFELAQTDWNGSINHQNAVALSELRWLKVA
jgi:hypothetical protein